MSFFDSWKSWHKSERIIFRFCSVLILLAIIFYWQSWLASPAPVITYDHFQQVQKVESIIHTFQVGLINIAIPADSYVILENIFGSRLQPNVFAAYIFLTALSISFLLFISIISTFTRFWFLMGMGFVMLFLGSLRLEAIEAFGLTNKTIAVVLVVLFGGLAFYFHSIKKETTFGKRLLSFLILIMATGEILSFFSKVDAPLLHVSVNGLIFGIILSLIFVLMVSHEIIVAFVTITTQRAKSSRSLLHFLVLTVAYLINLSLMFASKMHIIDWSFLSVNSFFILTLSAVLGLWGFHQRRSMYKHLFSSESIGLSFYCSLMSITFATIGYFFASASDMMIDAFDDLIIAAHVGAGIVFALYVIANFGPMLAKNMPVYKVLFKPETMPYFTFRIMSVIATYAVLSSVVYWKIYVNQATASYYHAYGDLYLAQKDDVTAEAYYLKSLQFRDQNLHAHYGLASIYAERYDSFKEKKEYEKAKDWTPSVPIYLNLSKSYSSQGDLLEAALLLDEGKKYFSKSGELLNAVGLSFLKLKSIDSAIYFFRRAEKSAETKEVGETNYWGASALFKIKRSADTLISFNEAKKSGVNVNALASANGQGQVVSFEGNFNPDSSLSVYRASLLCNYFINQKENADTSLIKRALQLAQKPENDDFKEQLLIASSCALYAQGQVKKALEISRGVAFTAGDGKIFSLIGLWLLEQGNPEVASTYFKIAADRQQPLALYHQAISETESDSLAKAIVSWDTLSRSKNHDLAAFAAMMKKVLTSSPLTTVNMNDEENYYFCKYKLALQDSSSFRSMSSSIKEVNIRAQAQVDRVKKWFALDEIGKASHQLRFIEGYSSRKIKKEIDQLDLMIAAAKGEWLSVQKKLSLQSEIPLNQKIYAEALLAEHNGNQEVARSKYQYLIKANNQFEEGIVAASRYFARDSIDRLKNFSLLVDGLIAKPNSVKILKQHILESIGLGFEQEAQDSLERLQRLISDSSFRKFIAAYPYYFSVETRK